MFNNMNKANPEFYRAGGTLTLNVPSYIERAADKDLLEALEQGQFCYILTPRQMGKSSLRVRTVEKLKRLGIKSVQIDLSGIGRPEAVKQWYLGQVDGIVRQLHIKVNYVQWWIDHSHLSSVQSFVLFLCEVVLTKIAEPIVIFVDEIDTTLSLPKAFNTDDYFAAIRTLYNDRAINPALERLSFVLLGVAAPSDLIKDSFRTPFNIGKRIVLTDFKLEEASCLIKGLGPDQEIASQMLEQILAFTGGHPYLTQKACMRVAEWAKSEWSSTEAPVMVSDLIEELFFSDAGQHTDVNLQFIRSRILKVKDAERLLRLYRRIRLGNSLRDDELDPMFAALKLSGLVKTNDAQMLIVRNFIYERVFDETWIKHALLEQTPHSVEESELLYDVFISYSPRDGTWVDSYLVPTLQTAGLSIWFNGEIQPGTQWAVATEEAISRSKNMLVVLSPDYVASQFNSFESGEFLRSSLQEDRKRLIPLLLRPTKKIPLIFASMVFADFTQEDKWDTSMKKLLTALDAPEQNVIQKDASLRFALKAKQYDTGVVRELLNEAFDSDEVKEFIYDRFRPLSGTITSNLSKRHILQLLIEYVEQQNLFEQLLDYVAQEKPRQYRQYAKLLET